MHSSTSSDLQYSEHFNAAATLTERRLRHVSSIQIRNLTPFPVRDAFASALTQPSVRPQFTPQGNLSDDLDITVGRKRTRKMSSTSTGTSKSFKSDTGDDHPSIQPPTDLAFRKRTLSKASISGAASSSFGSSSSTPSIRRSSHRARTGSTTSFSGNRLTESVSGGSVVGTVASSAISRMFSDHSQLGLEKVVNSRLVETFITVSVPPVAPSPQTPSFSASMRSAYSSQRSPPLSPLRSVPSTQPKSVNIQRNGSSSVGELNGRNPILSPSTSSKQEQKSPSKGSRSKSVSSQISLHKQKPPTPLNLPRLNIDSPILSSVPNYISSIHRPSVNPCFTLDDLSSPEVLGWTDVSMGVMKVELWGKVGTGWGVQSITQGKGKEKDIASVRENEGPEWKILQQWDVNLSELVPLPLHTINHLPSNTLLIHLSPPGQTFYIPPPSTSRIPTRTPSPSGHNSDPETSSSKFKTEGHPFSSFLSTPSSQVDGSLQLDHWEPSRGRHLREPSKTAGWQDFVKLATLQAVISDTKQSLSEIERKIEQLLSQDKSSILIREVAQRNLYISDLRSESDKILQISEQLRARIRLRKRNIRERREALTAARLILDQELEEFAEVEELLHVEGDKFSSLQNQLAPTRTTVLTTLSWIFPIDLLSPPDLLYTILNVPLPIPLSSTDPAPPLMLVSWKEVTEDGVATALGYAAQVVHMMAIYLGKVLVYPITCVGSRSLIKDGISAMVGPRMFPLFSKGVDMYRFEYAVFLLNKDIEMLMADKNLRALDMRHTLPNLKNLLLTLTDGDGIKLPTDQYLLSSPAVSGLESPPRATSPPIIELTQSTPPRSPDHVSAEETNDSDSSSGSTTPTVGASTARKPRGFLDLTPLTGFLRSRYPSSVRTSASKDSTESADVTPIGEAEAEGTIEAGSESGASRELNNKPEMNGHGEEAAAEKHLKEVEVRTTARIPLG